MGLENLNSGSSSIEFPKQPWQIELSSLEPKMSKERFIQECAIALFANVDFNNKPIPVETAARDCILKAMILEDILDDNGNKVRANGEKGAQGDQGAQGT